MMNSVDRSSILSMYWARYELPEAILLLFERKMGILFPFGSSFISPHSHFDPPSLKKRLKMYTLDLRA